MTVLLFLITKILHNKKIITEILLDTNYNIIILLPVTFLTCSEVNSTISDEIMSSIRRVLAKSGFQFAYNNSKIISGEEEGSCGWITVNYLKKFLQEKHKVDTFNLFCDTSNVAGNF